MAHQYVSWASSAGRLGRSLSDDVALRIETRDVVIDLHTHTVWTLERADLAALVHFVHFDIGYELPDP